MKKGFILVVLLILFMPYSVRAIVFNSFGGKVESYNPAPPDCVSKITAPILTLTGGTLLVTVEELKISKPKSATLGILRVNYVPVMPLPTNIKMYYNYMVPGSYVLGKSLDFCFICKKVDEITGEIGITDNKSNKSFCEKIPGVKDLLKFVCSINEIGGCPVNNLIYNIGVSLPPIGITNSLSLGDVPNQIGSMVKGLLSKLGINFNFGN